MSDVMDPLDRLRSTDEYKIAKEQISDREWRLDNMYWIQNKDGEDVQFKRNAAQRKYSSEQWYRDVITKARQLGFSTLIEILILDDCLFRSNTRAAIIDATLGDAKKKLAKIKFAYDRLPITVRKLVRTTTANTEAMKFSNGSEITIGTTFRGDTPQILHVSEYGKISAESPETAKGIRTGAFNAVAKTGKIFVESTAHGFKSPFLNQAEIVNSRNHTAMEFKEQRDDVRIPPTPLGFLLHDAQGLLDRIRAFIRTRTGERVVDVGDLKDPGEQRDLAAA